MSEDPNHDEAAVTTVSNFNTFESPWIGNNEHSKNKSRKKIPSPRGNLVCNVGTGFSPSGGGTIDMTEFKSTWGNSEFYNQNNQKVMSKDSSMLQSK